jgi:sulfopyruvate decarboxylase TPP-binding subunit
MTGCLKTPVEITTGETDAFAVDAEQKTVIARTKNMNGTGVFAAGAVKKEMLSMTWTTVANVVNAGMYSMTVTSTIPYPKKCKKAA